MTMGPSLRERLLFRHHERRRAKKRWRRVRAADVVFVSHTKSGRTWLRLMVSHLFHARFGVPADHLLVFDEFHRLDARVPRIYFLGHFAEERTPTGRTWAEELRPEQKVVLLARDPRDVAVSFYHHMRDRMTTVELWRKGVHRRDEIATRDLFDVMRDERLGVPRVIRFLDGWRRALAGRPATLIVRYEDLRADAEGELRRIADLLGAGYGDAEIARAVAFASFDHMRQLEQQGLFASERLRPADPDNPQSFKVRRGRVGGYRDLLEPGQRERLDALVRERLPPAFGYAGAVLLALASATTLGS